MPHALPDRASLLVTLVGEQPIPPLLAIRALRPGHVVMLTTKTRRPVAERLARMVEVPCTVMEADDRFRFGLVMQELEQWGAFPAGTALDLTGGAKTTALALYTYAQRACHAFPLRVFYLRSAVGEEWLDELVLDGPAAALRTQAEYRLPPLLTADEYVQAHVGPCHPAKPPAEPRGRAFEQAVVQTLRQAGYDTCAGFCIKAGDSQREVDVAARSSNQVGVFEIKVGGREKPKQGLDQLVALAQREAFGTFVRRFLVLSTPLNASLARLAQEQHVCVVDRLGGDLDGKTRRWDLPEASMHRLLGEVQRHLGPPTGTTRP